MVLANIFSVDKSDSAFPAFSHPRLVSVQTGFNKITAFITWAHLKNVCDVKYVSVALEGGASLDLFAMRT
jgi:hypothetical protein